MILVVGIGLLLASGESTHAEVIVVEPGGSKAVPASSPSTPSKPSSNNNSGEKKPNGDDKKGETKEGDGTLKVIKRADRVSEKGAKTQLDVSPNEEGKLRFNFEGQPWPEVLEWLAEVSELSLDWQELPGDLLNLKTQRFYTVEETQDLINRHLLTRGYTMLKQGEMLTVSKISSIDVGLVPRVEPEELAERMPHEFVKVSFPLDWIIAEKAAKELEPMKSPNGKLTALTTTNRLEAMDAVINLREIHRVLNDEQSTDTKEDSLVREFKLEHVRANEIIELVEGMLGIESNRRAMSSRGGGNVNNFMVQQFMQQLQRMQQQQRGNNNNNADGGANFEPRLVVNTRENSILAHAPPDKMEIIAQTIEAIDVPSKREDHILQNLDRMKVYRLSTLDPEPLVQILNEMGDLSPETRIQTDDDNTSLIVYGPLVDHVTIQSLVDKLDGSTRSFEVIQLRRLRADAVAGTIKYMLGVNDEDDSKSSRRSSYYSYYSYGYGGSNEDKDDKRPFRVDADIDNNRLLIWANDSELEEVTNLLIKMGEVPVGQNKQTVRVLDLASEEDAEKVLESLRRMWPTMEPNELKIQPVPQLKNPTEQSPNPDTDKPRETETLEAEKPLKTEQNLPTSLLEARASFAPRENVLLAQLDRSEIEKFLNPGASGDNSRRRSSEPPPIIIQRGPNGQLILSSPDTTALDRLEDVVSQITPQQPDFHIFKLKNSSTWAFGIELMLEEFFEEEEEDDSYYDPWYGYSYSRGSEKSQQGYSLSRRKPLKFISDEDSHTILVQGATPEQLTIIKDLIDVYDQPTSRDPQAVRKTAIFQIKYSRAETIAETVKSVYRDLLSENDPALQKNNNNQQGQGTQTEVRRYTYVYGNEEEGEDRQAPIRFKGLLSVGVDPVSNTIVVSAAEGLVENIQALIERLDEAAAPSNSIQVIQIDSKMNTLLMQERLNRLLNSKAQQNQQGPKVSRSNTGDPQQNNQPQNAQPVQ